MLYEGQPVDEMQAELPVTLLDEMQAELPVTLLLTALHVQ
jgi:hypothetical protein